MEICHIEKRSVDTFYGKNCVNHAEKPEKVNRKWVCLGSVDIG
jgi:hypothetical protein